LRNTTEWIETVDDGWNVLCCSDREKILRAIRDLKPGRESYASKFGDGKASKKILEIVGAVIGK
jgi:UDP-N-acetylglucosamine 2-epimerase (non-hydrolysing)